MSWASANNSGMLDELKKTLPAELEIGGRRYHGYDLEMPEEVLVILEWPEYLNRRHTAPGAAPLDFCVIFSRDNRKATHPPDLCLEGGRQDIIAKANVAVTGVEGRGSVPCRELVVQSGAQQEYFIYTYRCGDKYTPSFWEQQLTIFANGLLNRNASGALIRVSTPVTRDVGDARERAMRLFSVAVPYLDRALP